MTSTEPLAINASEKDEKLLKEIRDFKVYAEDRWKKIREESAKDRRYIAGNPWEDEDRKARADAGRPCINHDELNQYVNAACNNLRQNKRGIKVEPAGNGSNDKTAELRQGLIRGIEYKNNAQQAYVSVFQQMIEGSYGFMRLGRRYVSQDMDAPDDQEITAKCIMNQDSVFFDPDCKEPDWSDAKRVLVIDPRSKEDFKRDFPDAKVHDFTAEDKATAKGWIDDRTVLVGEYWKVKTTLVWNTRKTRKVEKTTVTQYITNGLEILETNPQPGTHVGIIPCIGLQRYVDEGHGPELQISSLVRLARDPQMSLAFLCSQEIEEAGLIPKVPYIGYKGQFESSRNDWAIAHKQPFPFLEVDPVVDQATGQVLPKPERQQMTPAFQAYEVAKDAARRAIQAAMGISSLPTAAQRQNAKSGVALHEMKESQQIGSFHFNDNFDRFLQLAGKVIDEWIDVTYDTERDVALGQVDDSRKVVRINTPQPYVPEGQQEPEHYPVEQADHDITISAGPSNDMQREAAGEFLDLLVQNLQQIPPPGSPQAKLLAMAIRMKQLGPKGDEMADMLDPPDNGQGQQQAQALQQGQAQMQQQQEQMQKMAAELQQLQLEKQGRVIDNQAKKEIEQMKIEADLAKAEITTAAQSTAERTAFVTDLVHKILDQGHAAALQASDQQHAHELAATQAQHDSSLAGQQADAQQGQQAADQQHQLTMQEQQAQAAVQQDKGGQE